MCQAKLNMVDPIRSVSLKRVANRGSLTFFDHFNLQALEPFTTEGKNSFKEETTACYFE